MTVGPSTAMAGASYGVMSNIVKPLTNAQTVRGRPAPNDDDECAFQKGSFCELLSHLSNVAIKFTSSKEINECKIYANYD